MTKTELQTALATATNTDKRTAGVFLETLSGIAARKGRLSPATEKFWACAKQVAAGK